MKKLIFIFTALFLTINALGAEIANGTCGDNVTWSLSDEGVLTISGSGSMRNASDQYIDGIRVTDNTYGTYYTSIKSVVVNFGVTSIGGCAFYGCSSLTSITIPSSVKSIGYCAFYYCSGLTSITIPSSVTSIEGYAFYGCSSLPVENNIRYADTYLVGAIDKTLSSYNIKEGTKFIGTSAFDGCKNLTSITIPSSVTSIENYAFSGCM